MPLLERTIQKIVDISEIVPSALRDVSNCCWDSVAFAVLVLLLEVPNESLYHYEGLS